VRSSYCIIEANYCQTLLVTRPKLGSYVIVCYVCEHDNAVNTLVDVNQTQWAWTRGDPLDIINFWQ